MLMAENNEKYEYQSDWQPLYMALDTFISKENLIKALVDGKIRSKGRYGSENSPYIKEEGKEITQGVWADFELVVEGQNASLERYSDQGSFGYKEWYTDLEIHAQDAQELIGGGKSQQTGAGNAPKRKRRSELHEVIGKVFADLKDKVSVPSATDVWESLSARSKEFPCITQITRDKILWQSVNFYDQKMGRARFNTVVSEFRNGKKHG